MKNRTNKFLSVVLLAGMLILQSSCAVFAEGEADGVLRYTPKVDGFVMAPNKGNTTGTQILVGLELDESGNRTSDKNRVGIFQFDTNKVVGEYPVKTYDFNDNTMQDFAPNANVTGEVSDGVLTLKEFKSTDIRLETPNNLGLDASKCKSIKIRLKNNTNVSSLNLFFATTEKNYSSAQRITMPISNKDTDFHEYVFYVADNVNWTGTIRRLRLDCGTGYAEDASLANTMEFDSVSFIGEETATGVDFTKNDYQVTLRIHALNHSSMVEKEFCIYGLPTGMKEQVSSSMLWNTASNIINYTGNVIYSGTVTMNSWNEFDVTDYVTTQTDGVYAFKVDMLSPATLAYFCDTSESGTNSPELVFTQTGTKETDTFALQEVTSGSTGETLVPGGTITGVSIKKNKEYDGTVMMMFAVYKKDTGALLNVYTTDITESAKTANVGESIAVNTDFKLPDNADMSAKVYFWNSLNQLQPITKPQTVQ